MIYKHLHGDELVNHDDPISDHLPALVSQDRTQAPQSSTEVRLGHGDQAEQPAQFSGQCGDLVLLCGLSHKHREIGV